MKTLLVARKSLLEIVREVQLLALTIALPLVFLVVSVLTYNQDLSSTYRLGVLEGSPSNASYITALGAQRYENGDPVFEITSINPSSIDDNVFTILENQKITALVELDDQSGPVSTRVTIYGNALSSRFYRASTLLETVLVETADAASGRSKVVAIQDQFLASEGPLTEFDLYAPGMIIFGLLMIIPQTAMLVSRELRWKTLNRLRITPMSAVDLLGGISLAQMIVAAVQVVVVLVAAILMGFNNRGSFTLAVLVGLAVSFSAIGQGLVVACFSQDDSQAANVGSTFSMIQVFLSGSFYQLPPLTIFTLAGHQIDVFDIFPATHGFRALQQVLTYGDGFQEIAFRLAATLALSIIYFIIGVFIFHRSKMRLL